MSTYAFSKVSASIVGPGGAFNIGYGSAVSAEGITIARANDIGTMTVGADGEVMHVLSSDKSGTVTVRLLKTSPENSKLMAMYDLQTTLSSSYGQNIITVVNKASGDVVTCRDVAFRKAPDLTYAKEGQPVEWVFNAGKIDSILGIY